MKKLLYSMIQVLILLIITSPLFSQQTRHISALAINSDNSKLAIADYGGRLDILNQKTNQVIHTEIVEGFINVIEWNHYGDKLALGFDNNTVQIRETNTWQVVFTIPPRSEGVGINWSIDDNIVYTSYGGMDELRIVESWDINNGIKIQEYPNLGPIFSLQPHGNFAISVNVSDVNLLNPQTMSSIAMLSVANDFENNYQVDTLDWSPDATHIAIGYKNGRVRIWNLQTYSIVRELELGNQTINLINLVSYNITGTRLSILTYAGLQVSWDTSDWHIIEEQIIPNTTLAHFNTTGSELILVLSGTNLVVKSLCDVFIEENNVNKFISSLVTGTQSGYINICLTENATYTLTSPLPTITGDITLIGNGASIVMAGTGRVFDVASTGGLTLKNLTVSGGDAVQGGAIYNAGVLSLEDVVLQSNVADEGGAIYNIGTLTMRGGALQNNVGRVRGGGIYNTGDMDLDGVNIRDNDAPEGSGVYQGG